MAPDLPPEPGAHATLAREHEYKRHGTVSLLAGIDLVTGKVHALVKDRHRSREFIEFLELLELRTYLEGNQSLACRSAGAPLRIHLHPQSRLLAQSRRGLLLETRPFRPAAHSRLLQQELKDRLMAAVDYFNHDPVVHTWTYRLDKAT